MRAVTTKEHLRLHDRQIAAMRDILREGIPMVAEIRRLTLETRRDLRAVAAMQKRTEEALKQIVDSRRATNGRTKGKAQ
jgi:phage terminase Nu1 subunit (DNA packaging protein)